MEKWMVIVEIDGRDHWSGTYSDLGAAQMAQESKRLEYYCHKNAVVVLVQV